MTVLLDRAQRPSRRAALVVTAVCTAVTVAAAAVIVHVVAARPAVDPVASPSVAWAVHGAPIAVGRNPQDVEAGAGYVWVSGGDDGSLTRIDPATGETRRIAVGGEPGQIVVADGAVWIRNLGDRITRVDTATLAVSAPIPGGGSPISGMAVGGGSVWLGHRSNGTVTRLDAGTLAPVGDPIGVGSEPRAMEFDHGGVYVVLGGEGRLARIDAATGAVTGSVPVGDSVGGMEVEDGVVYVAADDGVVRVPESTFVPSPRIGLEGFAWFEVRGTTLFVAYDDVVRLQRFDAVRGQPIGAAVTGFGDHVGRCRFAFDRLWMADTSASTLLALAPS